jgi:hypothetical protein
MKTYNIPQIRQLPLDQLSGDEFLVATWKEDGIKVLEVIVAQHTTPMTTDEFLNHCTACGGDWGAMLLTGIKALYPEVYNAIPDNMGHFAWRCLCEVLELLQVKGE